MTLKARLRKARSRYLKRRSNVNLRSYLTIKAKLGIFDKRMCAYYGVDHNLAPAVKRAICRAWVAGLVPTSTTGGSHAPGSFHFRKDRRGRGCGVDFGQRREEIGTAKGLAKMRRFQRQELWRFRRGRLRNLAELIGPDNEKNVLRSNRTSLAEGTALEQAHDNHVHEGYAV